MAAGSYDASGFGQLGCIDEAQSLTFEALDPGSGVSVVCPHDRDGPPLLAPGRLVDDGGNASFPITPVYRGCVSFVGKASVRLDGLRFAPADSCDDFFALRAAGPALVFLNVSTVELVRVDVDCFKLSGDQEPIEPALGLAAGVSVVWTSSASVDGAGVPQALPLSVTIDSCSFTRCHTELMWADTELCTIRPAAVVFRDLLWGAPGAFQPCAQLAGAVAVTVTTRNASAALRGNIVHVRRTSFTGNAARLLAPFPSQHVPPDQSQSMLALAADLSILLCGAFYHAYPVGTPLAAGSQEQRRVFHELRSVPAVDNSVVVDNSCTFSGGATYVGTRASRDGAGIQLTAAGCASVALFAEFAERNTVLVNDAAFASCSLEVESDRNQMIATGSSLGGSLALSTGGLLQSLQDGFVVNVTNSNFFDPSVSIGISFVSAADSVGSTEALLLATAMGSVIGGAVAMGQYLGFALIARSAVGVYMYTPALNGGGFVPPIAELPPMATRTPAVDDLIRRYQAAAPFAQSCTLRIASCRVQEARVDVLQVKRHGGDQYRNSFVDMSVAGGVAARLVGLDSYWLAPEGPIVNVNGGTEQVDISDVQFSDVEVNWNTYVTDEGAGFLLHTTHNPTGVALTRSAVGAALAISAAPTECSTDSYFTAGGFLDPATKRELDPLSKQRICDLFLVMAGTASCPAGSEWPPPALFVRGAYENLTTKLSGDTLVPPQRSLAVQLQDVHIANASCGVREESNITLVLVSDQVDTKVYREPASIAGAVGLLYQSFARDFDHHISGLTISGSSLTLVTNLESPQLAAGMASVTTGRVCETFNHSLRQATVEHATLLPQLTPLVLAGGGIALTALKEADLGNASMSLEDVRVVGCKGHYGGGLLLNVASVQRLDARRLAMSSNNATRYGGGIFAYIATTTVIDGLSLVDNAAIQGGGGYLTAFALNELTDSASLECISTVLNLTHVTVANNLAFNTAGGLSMDGIDSVHVKATLLEKNLAPWVTDLLHTSSRLGAAPCALPNASITFEQGTTVVAFPLPGGSVDSTDSVEADLVAQAIEDGSLRLVCPPGSFLRPSSDIGAAACIPCAKGTYALAWVDSVEQRDAIFGDQIVPGCAACPRAGVICEGGGNVFPTPAYFMSLTGPLPEGAGGGEPWKELGREGGGPTLEIGWNASAMLAPEAFLVQLPYSPRRQPALSMVTCPSGYCCSQGERRVNITTVDVRVGQVQQLLSALPIPACRSACEGARTGTLCGACLPGHSEAFGTANCVSNDHCSDSVPLFIVMLLGFSFLAPLVVYFFIWLASVRTRAAARRRTRQPRVDVDGLASHTVIDSVLASALQRRSRSLQLLLRVRLLGKLLRSKWQRSPVRGFGRTYSLDLLVDWLQLSFLVARTDSNLVEYVTGLAFHVLFVPTRRPPAHASGTSQQSSLSDENAFAFNYCPFKDWTASATAVTEMVMVFLMLLQTLLLLFWIPQLRRWWARTRLTGRCICRRRCGEEQAEPPWTAAGHGSTDSRRAVVVPGLPTRWAVHPVREDSEPASLGGRVELAMVSSSSLIRGPLLAGGSRSSADSFEGKRAASPVGGAAVRRTDFPASRPCSGSGSASSASSAASGGSGGSSDSGGSRHRSGTQHTASTPLRQVRAAPIARDRVFADGIRRDRGLSALERRDVRSMSDTSTASVSTMGEESVVGASKWQRDRGRSSLSGAEAEHVKSSQIVLRWSTLRRLVGTTVSSCASSLLSVVYCKDVDGQRVMYFQGGSSCYRPWQWITMAAGCLFVVGLPVLFLPRHLRYLFGLRQEHVDRVYAPFRRNAEYWFAVTSLFKLLLVMASYVLLDDPTSQVVRAWFIMFLCVAYLLLAGWVRPYDRRIYAKGAIISVAYTAGRASNPDVTRLERHARQARIRGTTGDWVPLKMKTEPLQTRQTMLQVFSLALVITAALQISTKAFTEAGSADLNAATASVITTIIFLLCLALSLFNDCFFLVRRLRHGLLGAAIRSSSLLRSLCRCRRCQRRRGTPIAGLDRNPLLGPFPGAGDTPVDVTPTPIPDSVRESGGDRRRHGLLTVFRRELRGAEDLTDSDSASSSSGDDVRGDETQNEGSVASVQGSAQELLAGSGEELAGSACPL